MTERVGVRNFGPYRVETSREDKELFPDSGLTKGDLIAYYQRVAEHLLPHLEQRPLVVQRFPDGIAGDGFFQKEAGSYFPDWIERVSVPVASRDEPQHLVVCNNRATLAFLADQACITLHPWLSRADHPDRPDRMLFDLDPPDHDFSVVRAAALRVRDLLDDLSLPSFVQLTGSRGVHIVVPLAGKPHFDAVRQLARRAMRVLAERHADTLTVEQRINKRAGRLYLDTGRNAFAQTAVAPYAVRARAGAPVAAPVDWVELERGGLTAADRYTVASIVRRLGQKRDPWAAMQRRAHTLDAAGEALARWQRDAR